MNCTKTIIHEAAVQALETMAFMSVSEDVSEVSLPGEMIVSRIDFVGPQAGSLEIASDLAFAVMFAQNVSGLDEIEPEEYLSAMAELANVTCGLILPLLANSPSDVFDVTVPTRKFVSREEFSAEGEFELLNAEEFALAVRLKIDQ